MDYERTGIMSHSMNCRPIPYRHTPHASKLFLQYIENFAAVSEFYAEPPNMDAAIRSARQLKYPATQRETVATILREQNTGLGAGTDTLKNLERMAQGAAAIVTGQQVGLFSGPAYAIYKALTAIQVAQEMSQQGVPSVPVFWMATEDHDLAEVNHCFWFHENQLTRLEMPSADPPMRPVGTVLLGEQVAPLVEEAAAKLSGPGAEMISRILRESYTPADTYGSAFGRLFARLFEEDGLILLDPLDARLHRLAAPVFLQAVSERDALNEALLARGKQLEKAGYSAQVKVTPRSTTLFHIHGGLRQPVTVQNKHYDIGDSRFTRDDLMHMVEAEPESFSPNALLRSVVQDSILQTAAYVAGPTEIAYFAQSEVLYRKLPVRMPVILPRAAYTIVEPRIAKLLERYDLSVEDVWTGREKLRAHLESKFLPAELAKPFDEAAANLDRDLKRLEAPLAKLDATLAGALDTAHRKMAFQLENLRQKVGRAREQREEVLSKHEEILTAALYPNRVSQQRALCFLPLLAAWGLQGMAELRKLALESLKNGNEIIVCPQS